jgi:NADH:ubiquinone oxidoreductase subunit 6 (subunit J)
MLSGLGRPAAPAESRGIQTGHFEFLDTTLTIIFYVCSGLAIAGSLAATLASARWRGPSLLAVAVGTAAALASLSAGFAALLVLVALGACALLIGELPPDDPAGGRAGPGRGVRGGPALATTLGAVTPVLLLAVLLYAAWRGGFASGHYPGGWFGAAALGRAFFGHDALAFEAAAGMLLVGLAGGAVARGRP